MTGGLLKGLRSAIFLSIAIIVLTAGCNHPRPTPEDSAGISYEISQTLVGKQITVRGKYSSLLVKGDSRVVLDNQQEVWIPRRSEEEDKMDGKLVEATGTLRFYHDPTPLHQTIAVQLEPDHFYFEAETAQLRLVSP